MYLTTFVSLLVLSAALNCPLSQDQRSTAFSGSLAAEPDSNYLAQDMRYTHNFGSALAQPPQVCLCLSGYEDQNRGFMAIYLKTQQVSQQSFVVRVTSPAASKWSKLGIHYLASTKREIQIGLVSADRPPYDSTGYFTLQYRPVTTIARETKVRYFLVGIDIKSEGGPLAINFVNSTVVSGLINFIFSSPSCSISSLSLSVVIFDPTTPGLLFLDGEIQQNSLSTSTQVKIERTFIEELRIYFVGFNSLNAKDVSGIQLSVSFSSTFSLLIDSTQMKSIRVNYLVIAFVECGSCGGYPLSYGDSCYASCPQGTQLRSGTCVPIDCSNGYQLNANMECVPVCGPNRYYSGKSCTCVQGYNMINGECAQCPPGTYYNYMVMRCQSVCGENAQYNAADRRCYCHNGYVVVNGQCSTCPAGTQYDPANQQCLNRPIDCGANEVIAYGKCLCANGFFRINGVCQKCPPFSTYSLGDCQCNPGYIRSGGSCTLPCKDTEVLTNGQCQCKYGLVRNAYGECAPVSCRQGEYWSAGQCVCIGGYTRDAYNLCVPVIITCPQYEKLVNQECVCINGYARGRDGRCSPIQCQPGYAIGNSGECMPRCAYGSVWNQQAQRCYPQCSGGLVYDANYGSCVPTCQPNYRWNGTQCACQWNCPVFCPPGTYLDSSGKCSSYNCPNNQVWANGGCACPAGMANVNGNCVPVCRANAEYINGRCTCIRGYYDSNGICLVINCPGGQRWQQASRSCVSLCSGGRVWSGSGCVCPASTWQINGFCTACLHNEVYSNGRCECVQGLYRIGGVCSSCPPRYEWSPVLNTCVAVVVPNNCANGKVWNGYVCVCPAGTVETPYNTCAARCGEEQVQLANGQCRCRDGFTLNQYGLCVSQCGSGLAYVNGNCVPACGKGEEWSGYNCVCMPNYERVAPSYCTPGCGRFQVRRGSSCDCVEGYQRRGTNQCLPVGGTCLAPHQLVNGVCVCAAGFERLQNGQCVGICQPGYTRNGLGFCVVSCSDDKILIDGKCACRVGLYNVSGVCKKCPLYSYQVNGQCFCSSNNYLMPGGTTCPVPVCSGSSQWNPTTQGCVCRPPLVWLFGQCQMPRTCSANEVWNGNECVCVYGYRRVGAVCQFVDQVYYCPDNSVFNGVNCQCHDGYYPSSNQACLQCPFNQYWNGRQCGQESGQCSSGYRWDSSRRTCSYVHTCRQNERWDGARCVCSQGYFWIDNKCQECPAGTVFDGRQCSRGQSDPRCGGPYSYFNGYACVCIPGFWQLAEGCVTCPSGYEWSGTCCLPQPGLLRSVADAGWGNTVPPRLK